MRTLQTFPGSERLLALTLAAFLSIEPLLSAAGASPSRPALTLALQRRERENSAITVTAETVDPRRVGVVVVDMWNWHWCKTSTMRVGALVPRMNQALAAARALGMQVFMCPTDVADNYVGTTMVESLIKTKRLPVPQVRTIECPAAPDGGGCTCGRERCQGNYGWDGMNPSLMVGETDLMPNDQQMLYSLCQERGITHLIYMGVHTQVCLLGKSIGLRAMSEAGLNCVLARDLTDAHGRYDPASGLTPDQFTSDVVAHFEKYLSPTINMGEMLQANGCWDAAALVDPIRIAPWGTLKRPHLFEKELIVTLTTPGHPHAQIRYTLDGTEPSLASPRYSSPLTLRETALLRSIALEEGRPVCLPSEAYFARLGPQPPAPDLHLSDLNPLRAVGPGHSPSSTDHRFSPGSNPPQRDATNQKQPLRLRGKRYAKGMGVQAPNQLIYELKPEYERFVALAGVDEYIVDVNHASNLGMYPSVVFKVFLDGRLVSSSPVMKLLEEPWRFDVPIPAGSSRLVLVASDAGDGNRADFANWVNAGFVTRLGGAAPASR